MLTHEYTYAYGAVDVLTGALDSLILPHVNTACMQLFLDEVSARHPHERIVMVIDGAGWHSGKALSAPDNIYLLRLPPYAPELNPIEHLWDELREKFFHNRVFQSLDALEDHLATALKTLELDPHHGRFHRVLALDRRGAYFFIYELEMELHASCAQPGTGCPAGGGNHSCAGKLRGLSHPARWHQRGLQRGPVHRRD